MDILASEMMEVDQRLYILRNERGLPDTHPAVAELAQRRDALQSQATTVREQFEEQLSDYEVARRSRQSLVPEATVDPTPEELAAKRERVDRVLSGAVAGAQPVIERASDAVTGANSAIAQTVQSMTSDPLGTAQSAGESIVQAHLDVMNQAYDAITGGPVARDMEQTARQLEKSVPRNYFRNFRSPQENAMRDYHAQSYREAARWVRSDQVVNRAESDPVFKQEVEADPIRAYLRYSREEAPR